MWSVRITPQAWPSGNFTTFDSTIWPVASFEAFVTHCHWCDSWTPREPHPRKEWPVMSSQADLFFFFHIYIVKSKNPHVKIFGTHFIPTCLHPMAGTGLLIPKLVLYTIFAITILCLSLRKAWCTIFLVIMYFTTTTLVSVCLILIRAEFAQEILSHARFVQFWYVPELSEYTILVH